MAASYETISRWFDSGLAQGATHLVVVCDTFDWEDYPVYVERYADLDDVVQAHSENMQKVMEVYCYAIDKESQMAERRAWHLHA